MQVYRARNPKKSPLWQIAHRHYDEFEAAYPEAYQPRYGVLRRTIPEVVQKFLECGNLERGFARIRCDHCEHEYLLAFSTEPRCFPGRLEGGLVPGTGLLQLGLSPNRASHALPGRSAAAARPPTLPAMGQNRQKLGIYCSLTPSASFRRLEPQ